MALTNVWLIGLFSILKIAWKWNESWLSKLLYLLGAASTSDDELSPSDEDEECQVNRDQPHLRFEITSDDGFSAEADSIEGESDCAQEIFLKSLRTI